MNPTVYLLLTLVCAIGFLAAGRAARWAYLLRRRQERHQ